MISIKDLRVTFGKEAALSQINLQIEKNSSCAIIGSSGCGKSTLLYSIAGLIRPEEGEIIIDGSPLQGVRKNTGVILQDYGLLPWKTVWQNVNFVPLCRGEAHEDVEQRVQSILEGLGVSHLKDKYPVQLSGGEKQRVAIARTLVLEPDLLLMDEPSSALDAISKEHLQNAILDIYKSKPTTLLIVTHNIEEAVFLGQKIVVMEKSKISHIMDNPYFGMDGLRENLEFYRYCLEVRKWIV